MKKVLFTDLVDTLINSDNDSTKEIDIVSRYLNEFLSTGNYVAIVTSPNGHGSIGYIFNDMLIPLHELEILYDEEITLPLKEEAEKTFIKR